MAHEEVGSFLGLMGKKKIFFTFFRTRLEERYELKAVINDRRKVVADYEKLQKAAEVTHSLKEVQKQDEEIKKLAEAGVKKGAKLFLNSALITKGMLKDLEAIATYCIAIERRAAMFNQDPETARMAKELRAEARMIYDDLSEIEREFREEQKGLFALEAAAQGKEGMRFLMKQTSLDVVQKVLKRYAIRTAVKDAKKEEGLEHHLEGYERTLLRVFNVLENKKKANEKERAELLKEEHKDFKKFNDDLKKAVDLAKAQARASYKVVLYSWINVTEMLYLLIADLKMQKVLEEKHYIPQVMAQNTEAEVARILHVAFKECAEAEQPILNQLFSLLKKAEKTAKAAS